MLTSSVVDHGFLGGVALVWSNHGFTGGVMVSLLPSSVVDHGFITCVVKNNG